MAYDKPPIIEAIIELRFETPISFAEADKAASKVLGFYEVDENDFELETQMQVPLDGAGKANVASRAIPVARRLSSADRSELLLVRTGSLTYSQLAPYPGWDAYIARVKRDYTKVKESLGYRPLSRIGVRFINRIDIPIGEAPPPPLTPVSTYLSVGIPTVPVGDLHSTAYTFQIDKKLDEATFLMVISATAEPIVPNTWALVLDMDVARVVDIPKRDADIWSELDRLRQLKNQVFEACITDAARNLFRK